MANFLNTFYTLGFALLGLYGCRILFLTLTYLRVRHQSDGVGPIGVHPWVTVQLPIFNERHVAERAIEAACRLEWPADRLEVQVLDDSTDDTCAIVDAAVAKWRAQGVNVVAVRRADRVGFKAGALAHGMTVARGSVFAVFDADFVPGPDFLVRTVGHLAPDVAAVQARWGHLNAERSGVTHAQALALDGHFMVEQTARSRTGMFLHFNGTAGIWRREAIEAAGGWQADTLSEDIDLSYRAQLAGWRLVFLPDVVAPAELPVTVMAFKRQQRRWAMGTTQVLFKLGPRLMTSKLPLATRVHALSGLVGYLNHAIGLILFLGAPLLLFYHPTFHAALGFLGLFSFSPSLMYSVSQSDLYPDWPRRMLVYPVLCVLAVGLSLTGTIAVVQAFLGQHIPFERTPKSGDRLSASGTRPKLQPAHGPAVARAALALAGDYRLPIDSQVLWEAALAVYAWVLLFVAIRRDAEGLIFFLALFAAGFTAVAMLSVLGELVVVQKSVADSAVAQQLV